MSAEQIVRFPLTS